MDEATLEYRRYELSKVDAGGEFPAKLQIVSDFGSTKHLNITEAEFLSIAGILTGELVAVRASDAGITGANNEA